MLTVSGCVIGEPDFTPPERTRPQLRAINPPNAEIRPLVRTESDTFPSIRFEVELLSEDDGQNVSAALLVNYGHPTDGRPYEESARKIVVPPGSLSEGARLISITWTPRPLVNQTHTCKKISLHVTHERFNQTPYEECAVSGNDAETRHWFIPLCNTLSDCNAQDCVGEPEGGYVYCPDDPASKLAEDNQ